jgi:NAD(P)-dependent dehydrogenase (short-subunit alcohol dehydrogenase family)/acyl carrier protein
VLITGGTGAVGGHLARWLAGEGAEHLVLTSRRGPAAGGTGELEAELTRLGAKVTIAACDVSDAGALGALIASLDDGPPLTAVLHAAGVLPDETPLPDLTLAGLADTTRSKAAGATHLDRLLGDRPLDAFVLFSSGAAIWGSAGRAGYAAANAFLDGLAQRRRARGLAATSIAWGSWGGGMVGDAEAAALGRLGLSALDPALAVEALLHAVEHDESGLVVADIDWARFTPVYTLARPRPLLRDLPEAGAALDADTGTGDTVGGGDAATALSARLAGLTPGERSRALLGLVREQAAVVLGHDGPGEVEPGRAFKDLGFDSVSAVDLRNRLGAAAGLRLPATVVFDHATPRALAEHLGARLAGDEAPPVPAVLDQLEALVADMSRREIEDTRISARLQALMTTLHGVLAEADGADVRGLLDGATAEDVFDFLDNELGSGGADPMAR